MVSEVLLKQLDYILFLNGLSLVLLAIVAANFRRIDKDGVAWGWLSLFGFFQGINKLLEMLVQSTGDSRIFALVRTTILIISFLFLLEFSWSSIKKLSIKTPKRRVFVVIVLMLFILAFSITNSDSEFNAVTRYIFGLSSGLGAVCIFWYYRQNYHPKSRILLVSIISLLLYTISTGLIVPKSSFFLASILNNDSFRAYFGFTIDGLRCFLAVTISWVIWEHYKLIYKQHFTTPNTVVKDPSRRWLICSLLTVVAVGWYATSLVGDVAERDQRRALYPIANALAASLNPEDIKSLTSSAADIENLNYQKTKESLIRAWQAINKTLSVRFVYLMQQKNGEVVFSIDTTPEDSSDYSEPGQVYFEASAALRNIFKNGDSVVEGPLTDRWGTLVSVLSPISDPNNKSVIAILGMDIDASDWTRILSYRRLYPILITLLVSLMIVSLYLYKRRLSEATIKIIQNEELYRAMFEKNGAMQLLIDPTNGKFLNANESAIRFYGYSREKLMTMALSDIDIRPVEQVTATLLDTTKGVSTNYEGFHRTASGEIRNVEIHSCPIWARGKLLRYTILHDITDRKVTENALRESNHRLEELIERANDLAEKATAANNAKSEFLANMSHEIRTPMNGVLGMIELLCNSEMSIEQRQFAEIIRNSGQTLLAIINNILDYAKCEAGKFSINPVPFSLRACIERTASKFLLSIQNRELELFVNIDDSVPDNLVGDDLRIEQVLTNLLGNAIKFISPHGVIIVTALKSNNTKNLSLGSIRLEFVVSDTGIGISEKECHAIFEPFKQVDGSMARKYGGTGLGLSICRELVNLMEGVIWVKSKQGIGSSFHFTATLENQAQNNIQTEIPVASEEFPENKIRRMNILLAEDNFVNQILGVKLLVKHGQNVTVANNGTEAFEKFLSSLKNEPFDIIFMDWQMPVMDGCECTRLIRKHEKNLGTHIPIIAMTAHAMTGDREKCLNAGMDDYLSKPIDIKRLKMMLAKYS